MLGLSDGNWSHQKVEQLSETCSMRTSETLSGKDSLSIHMYKLDEREENNSGNVSQESESKETQIC